MRKEIKVYSDDYTVSISTTGNDDYLLQVGEFSKLAMSEEQLRELKSMIDEILQLVSKRDW